MNLFQPDTVLAPQFFATLRRQGPSKKGEWQLLIAILEDAVNCFQKYFLARDNSGRRLYRDACEWIMEPQPRVTAADEVPGFTFEYICDVLGLDPDYLRQGLARWRERQLVYGAARLHAVPALAAAPLSRPERYPIAEAGTAVQA